MYIRILITERSDFSGDDRVPFASGRGECVIEQLTQLIVYHLVSDTTQPHNMEADPLYHVKQLFYQGESSHMATPNEAINV